MLIQDFMKCLMSLITAYWRTLISSMTELSLQLEY
jgi:hypothetical protein